MATIPLTQSNPELAQEWHPTLNGDLTPDKVSAGSARKVWWLGRCGHEWEAQVGSRAIGRGCGYCSGNKVLKGFNDLATEFPEIASQWDYEKNQTESPETITSGSRGKYWWICPVGHSWIASVYKRTSGGGCGVCRNLTFVPGVNDLATIRPDIASEWDYEKNGELTPQKVGIGTTKKVWWKCSLGHSFDSTIDSRCRDGKGCRICAGRELLIGFNDLLTRHPELAQEWHPTKNGMLKPENIHGGQPKNYWWLGKCGHEWEAKLTNRANGSNCPYCSNRLVLAGFNDLATTHPELTLEWHPTKNGNLVPSQLLSGSREKIWWLGKCGHEWIAELNSRANSNQVSCPECSMSGYTSTKPGILYFIHNPKLLAFKVGITNQEIKTDRLKMFVDKGWRIITTWERQSGRVILDTETTFFTWLRREMNVPRFLDRASIGLGQGATETFSDSVLTEAEVIAKLEELLAQFEG